MPWSVAIHAGMLVAVILFGADINSRPIENLRVINVRLAQLPETKPEVVQTQPVTPPDPVVVPEPEKQTPPKQDPPEMAPKQKPEPEEKKPEQKKPEPVREEPRIEALEPQVQQLTPTESTEPSEAAVSATDKPFPFTYYLNIVEARISRQWQPRQLGFDESNRRSCVVHFFIERSGLITRATIARGSGIDLFDREALRAVQTTNQLPPLPARFSSSNLGVTFVFTLESGL